MIELDGVEKSFDRPVLRNVSLRVESGSLYGLIGPGAAGKSLVLKVVAGLVRPEHGRVLVGEHDVSKLGDLDLEQHRKNIGMLFQNNALFDHMTVAENIAFPLRRLSALDEGEIAARVAERLACVSLSGFEDRMPSGLSGGQKKRVGVARATVTRAPIVLYDEPAAGLDPVTSQRIFDVLRAEQRASGATVLMVSSDLDRMLPVTDKIGMMHDGAVIFEGSAEEARTAEDERVRQFVLGLIDGPL
ncbi:MAG TPA: ATP-binding cassette domain-containing protein [Polyangiaceae bacterium]|nr:ATP-binding cassette domain-containing protein [Polyangiaceae bacterium]